MEIEKWRQPSEILGVRDWTSNMAGVVQSCGGVVFIAEVPEFLRRHSVGLDQLGSMDSLELC